MPLESAGRQRLLDVLEVEVAEAVLEELADLAHLGRAAHHLGEPLGGVVGEFVRRGQRRDDLRVGDEFVAVAVVAVGVGVDERPDVVGGGLGGAHGLEHIRRERHVEEGIDQQRLALGDDEAGVAPAPAAVGLDPGVTAGSEIVQTVFERSDSQRHRTSRAVPEAWDRHG